METPKLVDDSIELLVEDYLERRQRGETLSAEEFAAHHPAQRDRLVRILSTMRTLDDFTRPVAVAPARVGGFRILREIGRGGMGVVYEAVEEALQRRVALKVLTQDRLSGSGLARFQIEARTAAKLHHTNIVSVFAVGAENGVHFYAMQFIAGAALDVLLEHLRGRAPTRDGGASSTSVRIAASAEKIAAHAFGRTPTPRSEQAAAPIAGAPPGQDYWRFVARVGMQTAAALAHAHAQGVLHRDVKPANILVDEAGNAFLADFGLARPASDPNDLTQAGMIVGTPRYLSPERLRGEETPAGDVYALGATLYELACRRPAFDDEDRERLLQRIHVEEPTAPRSLVRGMPIALETIVKRAMAKDPKRRYPSAEALAEDLRRFLDGEPILARRESAFEAAGRWMRRRPLAAGLAAALFVSVTAGLAAALALWQRSEYHLGVAEENLRRARSEFRRAEAERTMAVANLRKAVETIDTFLLNIDSTHLWAVPGAHRFRRTLASEAVAYLEKLAQTNGATGDSRLAFELGRARFRYGNILKQGGDAVGAAREWKAAIALFERRLADAPDDAEAARWLGQAHREDSKWSTDSQQAKSASAQRSLELLSRVVKDQPEDLVAKITLANTLCERAYAAAHGSRYKEAESHLAQAQLLVEHVLAKAPNLASGLACHARVKARFARLYCQSDRYNDARVQALAARGELSKMPDGALSVRHREEILHDVADVLAVIFSNRKDFETARTHALEAYLAMTRLIEFEPDEIPMRLEYLDAALRLAQIDAQCRSPSMVRELLTTAVENAETLRDSAADPAGRRAACSRLARAHSQWTNLDSNKEPAKALPHAETAIALLRELAAADPNNYYYPSLLGGCLHNRGLIFERLGRHSQAEPDVRAGLASTRRALQLRPRSSDANANLSVHLMVLARMRSQAGDWKETVDLHDEWLKLTPARNAGERVLIASGLAAAATALGKDPTPANLELKKRAASLSQSAAVSAISQTAKQKSGWLEGLTGVKTFFDAPSKPKNAPASKAGTK